MQKATTPVWGGRTGHVNQQVGAASATICTEIAAIPRAGLQPMRPCAETYYPLRGRPACAIGKIELERIKRGAIPRAGFQLIRPRAGTPVMGNWVETMCDAMHGGPRAGWRGRQRRGSIPELVSCRSILVWRRSGCRQAHQRAQSGREQGRMGQRWGHAWGSMTE